jgi:hypothetical protein
MQEANTYLAPDQHAAISAALCEMHGVAGARAALQLAGLPLAEDVRLRMTLHQWPQVRGVCVCVC